MQNRYAKHIPEGRAEARKEQAPAWDAEADARLALGVSTVLGERAYRKKGQAAPSVLKRVIERGVRVPCLLGSVEGVACTVSSSLCVCTLTF